MEVCSKLLFHVCRCTAKKRTFLEQVDRDDHNLTVSNKEFRRVRDREISRLMQELPGKLDHAAVVAFEVGIFSTDPSKQISGRQANGNCRKSLSDELEMKRCDSFTELYSLCGN